MLFRIVLRSADKSKKKEKGHDRLWKGNALFSDYRLDNGLKIGFITRPPSKRQGAKE